MSTLLERAQEGGTPIIGAQTATFVWHGRQAPLLVGDFTEWGAGRPIALTEAEPGVWIHTHTFPSDAYIEYAYTDGETRVPDPYNRYVTSNGIGTFNNFFYMPEAGPTPLARRRRGVPQGTVTRRVIPTNGRAATDQRTVYLYRPPTPEPCPLVVVLDGQDYLRRAVLATIVDNLIAQGRIRPVALAMVANGRQARTVEYSCSEATLAFIVRDVMRLARSELNLVDVRGSPGSYGILGASLGGLTALYAGLRMPLLFGRVMSQSGSFTWGDRDLVVYDLVECASTYRPKIWMDVGRFEWLLETNRRLHALLASKGYDVTYSEYNAGHNFPAWRDNVWQGLVALFGVGDEALRV